MRQNGNTLTTGAFDRFTGVAVRRNGEVGQRVYFPPFPEGKFDVLYVDPPWDYKGQLQHNGAGGSDTGGAVRHYPTVPAVEMATWRVGDVLAAENALLFLWATSPHLDQAIALGEAWGFKWATVAFVWDKCKVNPGFYTMSQYELCLVMKRGKIPDRGGGSRSVRQSVVEERARHSAKPDEVRRRITEMFPQARKLEMFARSNQVDGWTTWGLEA